MKKLFTVFMVFTLVLSTSGALPNLAYAKNDNNNSGTGFSDCGKGNDKNNNGNDNQNKDLPCSNHDGNGGGGNDGGGDTTTGSITVCKIILDTNGNPIAGTEGQTFGIKVTGPNNLDQTANFSAPLTLHSTIVNTDDAQCQSIQNLPIDPNGDANNTYNYAQETGSVSDTSTWQAPRYDDQFNNDLAQYSDASTYVPDGQPGDTDNNDGVIILTVDRPDRTLIVVNQLKAAACNADEVQTAVSDSSNTFSSDVNGTGSAVDTYVHPNWIAASSIPGASWIWDSALVTNPTAEETVTFTKNLNVVGTPSSGAIDIAADNAYKVVVNGHVESDHLADTDGASTLDFTTVNHVVIPAGDLVSGANVIEITVKNLAGDADPHNNPAGLLYAVTVRSNGCDNPPPPQDCSAEQTSTTYVSDSATTWGASNPSSFVSSPNASWATLTGVQWIWVAPATSASDAINGPTYTFTRHFSISGTPEDSQLVMSSDNTYDIQVNGHEIASDQTEFNYQSTHTFTIPAVDLLPGDNAITFTVTNQPLTVAEGGAQAGTPENNPGGLLYKLIVNNNGCEDNNPPADQCPNIDGVQATIPDGDHKAENGDCVPNVPSNTCVDPNAINNVGNQIHFGLSSGPENTVQQMLDTAGYSIDASTQQTDTQEWDGTSNNVDFSLKFINGQSGDIHTFGYFLNGDSTFHPLFADGTDPANDVSVPVKAHGDTMTFSLSNVSNVVFGIVNYDPSADTHTTFYTKSSLNAGGEQRAVTYNPTADEYVIAFEDFSPLVSSDHDYNDMLVSVKVTGCDTNCPEGQHKNTDNQCVLDGNPDTSADLSIAKEVNNDQPQLNHNVDYTITVTNHSATNAATNVVVNDALATGLTFVSDVASEGTYVSGTGVWTVGTIPANGTATLTIIATVTTTDEVKNIATVTSQNDPNDGNDTSNEVDVTAQTNNDVTPNTPTDMCQNINGVQAEVPEGDIQQDGNCFPAGGGGGGGIHNDVILGGGGGSSGGHVLGASTDNNSCGVYLTSYLRYGRKNPSDQVVKLQKFLNAYLGLNLPLTGFFGQQTLAAVNQFQVKEGQNVLDPWVKAGLHDSVTDPTGYVYKTTKRWINLIMCNTLNLPVPSLP